MFKKPAHSIVTQLIVFGLVIAAFTGMARYFLLTEFLRNDLEKLVSSQQEALASYVARDIDYKIVQRQQMLGHLAERFPFELLARPQKLQLWLGERFELQPLFSQGLFVTDAMGDMLTSYPVSAISNYRDFYDRDFIVNALKEDGPVIGRSVAAGDGQGAAVPMAISLKDSHGRVRAVLVGITANSSSGFFDSLQQVGIGQSGGFLLISPRDHLFVAASKPEMALKPTPPIGLNHRHDQAMAGWRGSGITINAQGVEEISAVASVPSAGWFVVARLPTVEAFSTVKRVQNFVIRNGILIIIVFLILAGFGLRIILRPLASAARHADQMTLGALPLAPLPVMRDDEVGHLTSAFNRLLEKLLLSQQQLVEMAHHDVLTGLPNRLLLADRMRQTLAQAQRKKTMFAVLLLDLDGFKPINDTLGHEAGDQALIEVARRLSAIVREVDTLARIGGDEFVIVIGELAADIESAKSAAAVVASKCILAIDQPMSLLGNSQSIGVSIGAALGHAESSFDALLSSADGAMYQAKSLGKGCYVVAP